MSVRYPNETTTLLDSITGIFSNITSTTKNNINPDSIVVLDENEDMAYYAPLEGTNIWVDNMVIPANAENPELANAWISFMLSEDAQSRNTLEVGYTTVHQAVWDFMISDEGDYAGNEAYAVRTDYAKDEIFNYDAELKIKMSNLWLKIKAQ